MKAALPLLVVVDKSDPRKDEVSGDAKPPADLGLRLR